MAGSSKSAVEQFYVNLLDCIRNNMSKDETSRHLQEIYRIPSEATNFAWEDLERANREFFRSYYARIGQRNAPKLDSATARRRPITSGFGDTRWREQEQQQRQRLPTARGLMETAQNFHSHAAASPSSQVPQEAATPEELVLAMAIRRTIESGFRDTRRREQEQQQRQRLATTRRLLETAQNFQSHVAASPSSQVPQEAGNPLILVEQISSKVGPSKALENQNLQASQQPVYPTADFRQQLMIMLAKIERNTDQMVKLLTDIHGYGPHCFAVGYLKRQRVEQTKESGGNEEAENLQEKGRCDNEEAERQRSCRREREGSLKRQRVEQTEESGDNEEAEKLQEKERGDNEEAEKLQDQNLQLPQ